MTTLLHKTHLCVQPPGEGTDPVAPSSVAPAHVYGPLLARGDGVQESEADSGALGRQLLEAIKQCMSMQAASEEPVVVAPTPPTRDALPASPFDIEAAMFAVERATTEEEAMAAMEIFLGGAETVVKAAPDPFAALTTIFGLECVAAVTEVCAAAVVDLEAEAAATGGTVTERAGSRIARSMVHRLTMRAGRAMARAPRARGALRVRIQRAPRAHRAHRRAVRLSAVVSAGDGPPPPDPSAASGARDRAPLARTSHKLLLVALIDDVDVLRPLEVRR